jgi:acetolactate synthase-1/2/3 large subunit
MPTHAEQIAKTLVDCGVKSAFGLPGGEISAFLDACRRAGIRLLLTGHESSAAWMAQVTGQITGIPGVCFATLGPGATNLVTGVANAFLDRSPLLAITAQIPKSRRATMTHQRVDIEALYAPITKRTTEVGTGDTCNLVRECMFLASAPRPGPLMLVLPSDTAKEEDAGSSGSPEPKFPEGQRDGNDTLSMIRDRLALAQRPLILVGLGSPPGAAEGIRKLVETLQAPFVVTPKVKGILPEDHPLFLGVASGMAIDRDIVATVRSADLILGIGFDPVEVDKTWFVDVKVVNLDSVSMAEGNYRPLEAIGNLPSLVADLTALIDAPKAWPQELLDARRQSLRRRAGTTGPCVSPLALIEGLRSVFPRSGIVTCDVGSHKLLMGQFWRSYEPGTFFMSNGLSGMGFGVPAAIAAQLAQPDRAVMAVVGDGGMLMMLHELALIRELNLPVIIVVFVDNSLSLIRISQQRRGYSPCAVDFTAPNFVAIAHAFGIGGERAKTVPHAQALLENALCHPSPFVLEVPIDIGEYYDLV